MWPRSGAWCGACCGVCVCGRRMRCRWAGMCSALSGRTWWPNPGMREDEAAAQCTAIRGLLPPSPRGPALSLPSFIPDGVGERPGALLHLQPAGKTTVPPCFRVCYRLIALEPFLYSGRGGQPANLKWTWGSSTMY